MRTGSLVDESGREVMLFVGNLPGTAPILILHNVKVIPTAYEIDSKWDSL
jgi:hypothetical protein